MSVDSSNSSDQPRRQRSHSGNRRGEEPEMRKLFINNLSGDATIKALEDELNILFEKYGTVNSLVVKKNRNSNCSFAFVEMKDNREAEEAAKNLSEIAMVAGKLLKVEFQDDNKRRKDSNKGCYTCGKMGHFARECNSRNDSSRGNQRQSRSRSQRRHKHRHSRRSRSQSDDHDRKKKKDRKKRQSDRSEKRKKKHKERSSSDS